MENIRQEELPALIGELEVARERLSYIASFCAITDEYMALNNITFTWPQRIIPILNDHEAIIGEAKGNCQVILKERREKFEAELEDFSKQVEELQEVSDLDEMPFYVKKVLFKSCYLQIRCNRSISSYRRLPKQLPHSIGKKIYMDGSKQHTRLERQSWRLWSLTSHCIQMRSHFKRHISAGWMGICLNWMPRKLIKKLILSGGKCTECWEYFQTPRRLVV